MIKRALFFLMAMAAGIVVPTAQANPVRSAPTRPAAVKEAVQKAPAPKSEAKSPAAAAVKSAVRYVEIAKVAARYGMEISWLEPGRRVELKNAANRIEIEAGSRNMRLNGVRVFLGDPARFSGGEFQVSEIDAERLFQGLLAPVAETRRRAVKVIAIDPGHGGPDTGTENKAHGLREKVFTLDVSLRLKRVLEAKGYRVVMTRETDIDVGKGARAIIANQAGADVFVSVHFNAVLNDTKTRGAEIFTFAPQFQRSTNAWGPGQPDDTEALPAPVNRFDVLSVACAHAIHGAVLKRLGAEDRGQKIGHWAVLRALNCPGVLVEAGFLSNEAEGKKIATPEYRQQIAEAIADGLANYAALVGPAKE